MARNPSGRPPARKPRAGPSRASRPGGGQAKVSRPTSGRPTQQRRREPAPATHIPGPEPAATSGRRTGRLTGRAAVLGLAVCVLALTLAYPIRQYLAQRSQIAQLSQQQDAQQNRVAALEERRKRWEDPAYVKAQARQRLQYVMPGEVGYVVLDPGAVGTTEPAHRRATVLPADSAKNLPWYSQLWGTVPVADSR